MGFISKIELKKQLKALGVKIEGNFIKKTDLLKVLANKKYTIIKDNDEPEIVDEKRLKEYAQNMYNANVDDETPPPCKKVVTVEQAIKNIEWAGEEVESIIAQKNSIKAAAKTFKDPKDPSIVYTVKRTGTSQGRGVYEISTKIGILGDAYGKDELEGLKNYLSSRGMSDNLLKKI